MNPHPENKTLTGPKFDKTIDQFTLQFKEDCLEKKYHEKKMSALKLSKVFKIGISMLLFVVIFRRVELLIFSLQNIASIGGDPQNEYIQTGLLVAALLLEALFAYIEMLNKFKGLIVMLYIFFMVCFSSFSYVATKPCSVPMYHFQLLANICRGIPVYVAAIIIGAVYVHTWLIASLASAGGFVMHVVFNHYYGFPICNYTSLPFR